MSNPTAQTKVREFYLAAKVAIDALIEDVHARLGREVRLVPVRDNYLTHILSDEIYRAELTEVIVSGNDITFIGYPEHCEEDIMEWGIGEICSAEKSIYLLESLIDPMVWKRVANS